MSVYIATPYTRPHYSRYVRSLLFCDMPKMAIYRDLFGYAIDVARNRLVKEFLASGMQYLLFVDNDCSFPVRTIQKLMADDKPVVCTGMYTRYDMVPRPTIGYYIGKGSNGKELYRFGDIAKTCVETALKAGMTGAGDGLSMEELGPNAIDLGEHGGLIDIDGCGMHCTMIRRDVLEKLREPYFVHDESVAGEDFYFCRKVREAGFKICFDTSIHTGHIVGEEKDVGLRELVEAARFMPQEAFSGSWEIGI